MKLLILASALIGLVLADAPSFGALCVNDCVTLSSKHCQCTCDYYYQTISCNQDCGETMGREDFQCTAYASNNLGTTQVDGDDSDHQDSDKKHGKGLMRVVLTVISMLFLCVISCCMCKQAFCRCKRCRYQGRRCHRGQQCSQPTYVELNNV